jgi:hypothetical protein
VCDGVLRPCGKFIFFEHGLCPILPYAVAGAIGTLFRLAFEGCHVTRDIPSLIEKGGSFPKSGSYCWWGWPFRNGSETHTAKQGNSSVVGSQQDRCLKVHIARSRKPYAACKHFVLIWTTLAPPFPTSEQRSQCPARTQRCWVRRASCTRLGEKN